ncbi:fibronectin type III domain-containing protein [Streptomyces sp. NPDC048604]|uniref:fibronectin type III domain-containing protein n=1 Tax=Streptomyces sp. NPDC048604 TaxID=3365578 RepID=UPI003711AEF3
MTRSRLSALAATAALAATGGLISAAAPASAAVSCASPVWTAQYFANTSFSGTPKLTACDSAIAENMGNGDPAGVTLPNDNFSIRWSLTRDFGSGGPFTLNAATQDGMRVYVDGVRKIDLWKNVTATARKTLDLNIPAGKHTIRVDYVAWTGYAYAGFTYAPRTAATVDTVKPLYPTGLTAAYDNATLKTTLRWAANKEMDLAGYRVYRRLGPTQWAPVSGASPVTGTSFVDTPPATGQTYLYEVRAVDRAGRESAGSLDVTVASADRVPPGVPTGITVKADSFINTLRWQEVPDAVRYEVHVSATGTGPFTLLGSAGGAMYEDRTAPMKRYRYYQVRAFDEAGNAGAFSATAAGDGIDLTPPQAPTRISGDADATTTRIYWNMPGTFFQDLDNGGQFRVWRSPGTTFDPDRRTRVTCTEYYVQGADPIEGQCGDTGASRGTNYTYAVDAVDAAGNESELSTPVTVRSGDRVAPGPVTGVKATPRKDGVLVSWDASPEDDIASYAVWTGVRQDDGTLQLVNSECREGQSDPLAVLCGDLPDGQLYEYVVVAKDRWGNALLPGDPKVTGVEAAELNLLPSIPVTSDWPLGGGPVAHDTVTGGGYGPSANWKCENTFVCPTVTGYRVSRWNQTSQAYEPLTSELLPADTRSWTDHSATRGDTYFYMLEAVRADGSVAGYYMWYTVVQDRV